MKKNLLSLGQIDSLGCKTQVENGIMNIVRSALVLMEAENICANLFMLKGETLQEATTCFASNGEESTMMCISNLATCGNKVWRFSLGKSCFQGSNR